MSADRFVVQKLYIRRRPTYMVVDSAGIMPRWEFWGDDGPHAAAAAEFLNRGCRAEREDECLA